jgi:hypothetical protein
MENGERILVDVAHRASAADTITCIAHTANMLTINFIACRTRSIVDRNFQRHFCFLVVPVISVDELIDQYVQKVAQYNLEYMLRLEYPTANNFAIFDGCIMVVLKMALLYYSSL